MSVRRLAELNLRYNELQRERDSLKRIVEKYLNPELVAREHLHSLAMYVQQYATGQYGDGGWDVLVECWTVEEIAATLADECVTTERDAVRAFAVLVSVWAERQADARISSGQDH